MAFDTTVDLRPRTRIAYFFPPLIRFTWLVKPLDAPPMLVVPIIDDSHLFLLHARWSAPSTWPSTDTLSLSLFPSLSLFSLFPLRFTPQRLLGSPPAFAAAEANIAATNLSVSEAAAAVTAASPAAGVRSDSALPV